MFFGINSNEKGRVSSPANLTYKFSHAQFIQRDPSHSNPKLPPQREYCYSHSKNNQKNVLVNYDYPTWKQSHTNSQTKLQVIVKGSEYRNAEDGDCTVLKKDKTQLRQTVGFRQTDLKTKSPIGKKEKEREDCKNYPKEINSHNLPTEGSQYYDTKPDKNRLFFQVIELQNELVELQVKYQKMQKEFYKTKQNYDKVIFKEIPEKDEQLMAKSKMVNNLQVEIAKLRKGEQNHNLQRLTSLKDQNIQLKQQLGNCKKKVKDLEEENNKNTRTASTNFMGDHSIVSPLNLDNSEVDRLTNEIKKKNQMIKYLEYQCLRNSKTDQLDTLKSENSQLKQRNEEIQNLCQNLSKSKVQSEMETKDYKEKIKQLVYHKNQLQCSNKNYQAQLREAQEKLQDQCDVFCLEKQKWEKEKDMIVNKLNECLLKNQAVEGEWKKEKPLLHSKINQLQQELTQWKEKEDHLRTLSQSYNSLAKRLDEAMVEKQGFETQLLVRSEEVKNLKERTEEQREMIDMFKLSEVSRIEVLTEEFNDKEEEYHQSIQQSKLQIQKLEEQNAQLDRQLEEKEEKIAKMNFDLNELNQFLLQLQKTCMQKDEESSRKSEQVLKLQSQLKEKMSELAEAKQGQQKGKNKEKIVDDLNASLEREIALNETLRDQINERQMRYRQEITRKNTTISELQQKYENLKQQGEEFLHQIDAKIIDLQSELETHKNQIQFLKKENSSLSAKILQLESQPPPLPEKTQSVPEVQGQVQPQFIEIDKNALLYICDLMEIEPENGKLLSAIISKIQGTYSPQKFDYKGFYIDILSLFSISSEDEDAQQKLITELTNLVGKIKGLENEMDVLKSQKQAHKQGERVQSKMVQRLEGMIGEMNEEKVMERLKQLECKWKDIWQIY